MSGDRFVLLGLAAPRAEWFRSVARWATSAALPAEFVKCVSAEELCARLASGRPFSAALLDGALPTVDRDLLDLIRHAGTVAVVVDDGSARRDWRALGAAAVLPATFGSEALLDTLVTHATMVRRGTVQSAVVDESLDAVPGWLAPLAVVCGPGGTGTSVAAAALAQGVSARDPRRAVLLADLCMHAEQAMLHDVRDVTPGVQELVDAHRGRRLSHDEVRALTFAVEDRGYRLLLGLRRARYWSTLRARAFDVALRSLRETFDVVVCDVTGDVEGEADSGSTEVEERNLLARATIAGADLVFVVGTPTVKGTHALVRLLGELAAFGVPITRLVPVLNLAPRSPRERARLAATLAELASPAVGRGELASPVFLPRRRVEAAIRDAGPLPAPLPELLGGAFDAVLARSDQTATGGVPHREPELVVPGSLGHWTDDGSD